MTFDATDADLELAEWLTARHFENAARMGYIDKPIAPGVPSWEIKKGGMIGEILAGEHIFGLSLRALWERARDNWSIDPGWDYRYFRLRFEVKTSRKPGADLIVPLDNLKYDRDAFVHIRPTRRPGRWECDGWIWVDGFMRFKIWRPDLPTPAYIVHSSDLIPPEELLKWTRPAVGQGALILA